MQKYPRQHLREYIKFARLLLKGELPEPPSELDLCTTSDINFYRFAQGCYQLLETIDKLIHIKYQKFIRICNLIIITDSFGLYDSKGIAISKFSKSRRKTTKPITCFCRILNSRCTAEIKMAFDCIKRAKVTEDSFPNFKTKAQKKKILMKCIREMIKKGRVNLEQRAF